MNHSVIIGSRFTVHGSRDYFVLLYLKNIHH